MFQILTPDLGSTRRLLWTAAAVCLAVALALALVYGPGLANGLGDTDDAMRLALVRDLMHGRGWYDQSIGRLQPPLGLVMHWSRLIDGGIAGLALVLTPWVGAQGAETGARLIWPMLWIVPAVLSALMLARRLGGGRAVLPAAVMLAVGLPLYVQFAPGRVDHHNAQIALCLLAAAGAAQGGVRGAVVAGAAVALGLAVGLEALLFCALIAGAIALRLVFDRQGRRPAIAFGLSLAAASGAAFLIQTPPSRWGLAICDAMGANLVLGLIAGGLGLAAASLMRGSASRPARGLAVAGAGAAALVAYLGLDPHCIHGPMAEIDPRLYPLWLGHVQELMSWPELYAHYPDHVVVAAASAALGLVALGFALSASSRRRDFAWLLAGALFVLAAIMAASAARMESYLLWFAAPLLAAALAELARLKFNSALAPTLGLAVALSTAPMDVLAQSLFARQDAAAAAINQADHCYDAGAYTRLATLQPGLVLSEIDLGPYILARTPHSVLNAPYHRMSWGILAAQAALTAQPDSARAKVRALGVSVVAACPAHADLFNHVNAPQGSLLRRLDQGAPPAWLEPLSAPGEPLRLYRVR